MDRGPQMLIDYFFNDKTVLSASLLILKRRLLLPLSKAGCSGNKEETAHLQRLRHCLSSSYGFSNAILIWLKRNQ